MSEWEDMKARKQKKANKAITEGRVFAYLRVSTIDQDTEKNKADVLAYANAKGFLGKVEFVEERISGLKSWKKRKINEIVE